LHENCQSRVFLTFIAYNGIEAMNMIHKGQVKRLAGVDASGQAKFVASLFQIAA
jgi:hypothetical protein